MQRKHLMAVCLAGLLALSASMTVWGDEVNTRIDSITVSQGQYVAADGTVLSGVAAKGITVSKYQNRAGTIDWSRVAADGVSFAMVRLGYYNDLDPYYHENMKNAAANQIQTGVFFYTQALDVETARNEAAFVLEQIKNYPVSYPVAYDVESQYLLDNGLTAEQITAQVNAFCEQIAAAGYRPIVYGNRYWLTSNMKTDQIPYDIWYAKYDRNHEYPNRTIWQCTANGAVDGITGDVCLELAFVDYRQLIPSEGWKNINGKTYYYRDYQMQHGWQQVGNDWYYLQEDGTIVANTSITIDGVSYQFGADGVWVS